jgi:integrative and conjugative element protein (TIGR02256 family)
VAAPPRLPHLRARMTGSAVEIAYIRPAALGVIRSEYATATDGRETGGILLGVVTDSTAHICHAGGAGPAAIRRPDFFLRDLAHAQQLANEAFAADGSMWIGDWHSHLTVAPVPSARDLGTYQTLLDDRELDFDVFVSLIVSDALTGNLITAWAVDRRAALQVPLVITNQDTPITHLHELPGGEPDD